MINNYYIHKQYIHKEHEHEYVNNFASYVAAKKSRVQRYQYCFSFYDSVPTLVLFHVLNLPISYIFIAVTKRDNRPGHSVVHCPGSPCVWTLSAAGTGDVDRSHQPQMGLSGVFTS